MKKIILIATCWMIFSGCAKDVKAPDDQANPNKEQMQASASRPAPDDNGDETGGVRPVRAIATVHYGGEVNKGGLGWYLQVNDFEWEVPVNLSEKYRVEDLKVDVTYLRTDKPVENCNCREPKYMVEIIDITRVNEGGEPTGR